MCSYPFGWAQWVYLDEYVYHNGPVKERYLNFFNLGSKLSEDLNNGLLLDSNSNGLSYNDYSNALNY